MEVKFLNQPKEVKLGEILNQRLQEKFDKVYVIAGLVKDTGVEVIQDEIENAIKQGTKINVFIGVDRKNTSKDMMLKLLSIGCKLNIHINTDESKVEMRAFIFERKDSDSYIYVTGAKLSSGGLLDNVSIVTEIKYEKDDRKLFESAKNSILMSTVNEFHSIGEDEVILLAEKGDIVARITDRKIPRISEMYGNKESVIGEQVYDEGATNSIINTDDYEDVDIDIDMGLGMRENVMLETEKELKKEKNEKDAMLKRLSKSEKDLEKLYGNTSEKSEEKKKPTILMSNEIDYANMNAFMIEANSIVEKGIGAGEVKIPKSVADNLVDFFGGLDSFKLNEENKLVANVRFDIIDNKENRLRTDGIVKLILTDKGISILSKELVALKLLEGDIIRVIKEKQGEFRCEIIRKDTEEYNIWSCYLVNSIRGQKRRYGII